MNQTKKCSKCGEVKDRSEFYYSPKWGYSSWCKECKTTYERQHRRKPDGLVIDLRFKRPSDKTGKAISIHWDGNMLSIIRKHYPTSNTAEVAEMLGVSVSSVQRKARKLGLKKNREYMRSMMKEKQFFATLASAKSANRNQFPKGHTPWNKRNEYEDRRI